KLLTRNCNHDRQTSKGSSSGDVFEVSLASSSTDAVCRVHAAVLYSMLLTFALLTTASARAQSVAEIAADNVIAQIDAGQFSTARASIEQALAAAPSAQVRSTLEFQRERMRR